MESAAPAGSDRSSTSQLFGKVPAGEEQRFAALHRNATHDGFRPGILNAIDVVPRASTAAEAAVADAVGVPEV